MDEIEEVADVPVGGQVSNCPAAGGHTLWQWHLLLFTPGLSPERHH